MKTQSAKKVDENLLADLLVQPRDLLHWLIPLALGWLIPGAGHMVLGKFKRGLVLFVAISALFYTGVAVGGTMTVDVHSEKYWSYAQLGCGVHGMIGWHRQDQVYSDLRDQPEFQEAELAANWQMAVDAKLAERNIALSYPEDNIARVYTGVAGMLNVLCAIDAAFLALMILESKRKKEGVEVKA
jgi:hypothetical protein